MRKRLRHLPSGLIATAVLLVVGVPVGALLRGGAGAAGAAAGVCLVAVSYVIGSVVIAWADSLDPRLVLPAGLMTYVLKFTLPESRKGQFSGKAEDRKLVIDLVKRLNATNRFSAKVDYSLDGGGSSKEIAYAISFEYFGDAGRPTTAPTKGANAPK